MAKYFLISASRDHVVRGVKGGFAQAGHGRKDFISRPAMGDWIIYYSAKDIFGDGNILQKFTAIGEVSDAEPQQLHADNNFKPFRRAVKYENCTETDIRPLLDQLSFIKNKKRWGFYLMSGFREIPEEDFSIIKKAMVR